MPASLSVDLRERVVAYAEKHGVGRIVLSRIFGVGSATAYRWVAQGKATGSVAPKVPVNKRMPRIPDEMLDDLRATIAEKPDRTLREISERWMEKTSVFVPVSTMHRTLVRAGISLKKRPSGSSTERVLTSSLRRRRSARK